MPATGLRERLGGGGNLVVGEGYLLEMERRGYLQAGGFVPEVVLDHPQQVESLHREMVHAGSDVVVAFTYYGHREKLRLVGREECLEDLNRTALRMARKVADETGTLMAGGICNTTVYQRGNQEAIEKSEAMFKEQIGWAVEEGADYIVGQTFMEFAEAELALQSIKKYGNGLPAVMTMAPMPTDRLFDDVPVGEACRRLEEGGADVVGLNCNRGPATMLPLMRLVRQACKGPIACMPVGYNTTPECPTMHLLIDPFTGERAFPSELSAHVCGPAQVEHFAREAKALGVQYIGLCCGGSSICLRKVAEVYGRQPPASRFTPDMSKHFVFGKTDKQQGDYYKSGLKGVMSASSQ